MYDIFCTVLPRDTSHCPYGPIAVVNPHVPLFNSPDMFTPSVVYNIKVMINILVIIDGTDRWKTINRISSILI